MAQKDSEKDKELTTVDKVEVASLTDDDLETATGGVYSGNSTGSSSCCTYNSATTGCA